MNKQNKSEEIMSNKPLPWPYTAKEARDRSAEEAVVICRLLDEIVNSTNDPTILKATARAMKSATTILRHLESQGAPTKPE